MEAMKNMLRPKPNPQQQLREWQRKLRQEARNVERQVRGKFLLIILNIRSEHNPLECFFLSHSFSFSCEFQILNVKRKA